MARWLLVAVVGIFVVAGLLYGDDKPSSKDEKTSRTLPVHFTKLGLTESQKKKINEIKDDYEARVRDLEEQIRELRRKEREVMENVLTEDQKEKLRELRKEKAPSISPDKNP